MAKVKKTYEYVNGVRLIKSEGKQLDNPDYILDKLKCSIVDSETVVEYDKLTDSVGKSEEYLQGLGIEKVEKKKPKTKAVGVQDDDLTFLYELAKANFKPNEKFKNGDLAKLQSKFTNRQTPSRLKKLVESGLLKAEGTPKNYWYE